MRFSPFNPVTFSRKPADPGFSLVFSVSDNIMIECFRRTDEDIPSLDLVSVGSGHVIGLTWNSMPIGGEQLLFYILRNLDPGRYVLAIGELSSNTIIVTDDERILSRTVLLQYCQNDNRDRQDVVTRIRGGRYFFDFRVPGGFKDSDWDFYVDNEQFKTANSDVIELSATETTRKKLTIGTSAGIPMWMADMVNRAFTCDAIYIDGERYSRAEGSTPQIVAEVESGSRFIATLDLQQNHYLNSLLDMTEEIANRIAIRRTPDSLRRAISGLRRI